MALETSYLWLQTANTRALCHSLLSATQLMQRGHDHADQSTAHEPQATRRAARLRQAHYSATGLTPRTLTRVVPDSAATYPPRRPRRAPLNSHAQVTLLLDNKHVLRLLRPRCTRKVETSKVFVRGRLHWSLTLCRRCTRCLPYLLRMCGSSVATGEACLSCVRS